MLSVFDEKYDLLCRKYISNTAIPKLYSSTNIAVTNAVKDDSRLTRGLGLCRRIVSTFSYSWKKK